MTFDHLLFLVWIESSILGFILMGWLRDKWFQRKYDGIQLGCDWVSIREDIEKSRLSKFLHERATENAELSDTDLHMIAVAWCIKWSAILAASDIDQVIAKVRADMSEVRHERNS